jgi:hypothetical protein
MTRQRIKFTKQYKPIGFGNEPDPGTVDGHRVAMEDAALQPPKMSKERAADSCRE